MFTDRVREFKDNLQFIQRKVDIIIQLGESCEPISQLCKYYLARGGWRDRKWEPPTGLARGKRPHRFTQQQLWDPDYKFLSRQYEHEREIVISSSKTNLPGRCCLNISVN